MRGRNVFNTIIKDSGLPGIKRKGRNNTLMVKRNECLAARFYYYGHYKNMGYEEIIRLLVNEFFISPSTICFIVQDLTDQLHSLKQKAPPLYYFQNHWPHLKWL